MNRINIPLVVLLFISSSVLAQYDHQDVLTGQTGSTLQSNLVTAYKPTSLASYADARDNMFRFIFKQNDSITCAYTGLTRYLSNVGDPSDNMFDNASTVSINTEHVYPQSKTVNEAGKSDLHHLLPTRAIANTARSSNPFGDIDNNDVDKWYINALTLTSPPPALEEHLYSKVDNNTRFEPREENKGNVARAMFYYYTMYQSEANAADPNFFNNQKAILCQWHVDDPVDSLEWLRTTRIAFFQQNKENPFVLDCTLPQRCGYCSNVCTPPNSISKIEDMGLTTLEHFPNPAQDQMNIHYQINQDQDVVLEVYNNLGQLVQNFAYPHQAAGEYWTTINTQNLSNGLYVYKLTLQQGNAAASTSKTFVISH